jgi:uncharacterized membrane protein (DUF485 family)
MSLPRLFRRLPEILGHTRGPQSLADKCRTIRRRIVAETWPWITSTVPSPHIVRTAIWGTQRLGPLENIRRFLQRHGRYSTVVSTFFVVYAGLISVASFVAPFLGPNKGDIAASVLSVSEILGGIAGIVFAVVIFGVQFHGERLGEAAFLMRGFTARLGLILFLSVFLAVVAANLTVGLSVSGGLFGADAGLAVGLAWIDIALIKDVPAAVDVNVKVGMRLRTDLCISNGATARRIELAIESGDDDSSNSEQPAP